MNGSDWLPWPAMSLCSFPQKLVSTKTHPYSDPPRRSHNTFTSSSTASWSSLLSYRSFLLRRIRPRRRLRRNPDWNHFDPAKSNHASALVSSSLRLGLLLLLLPSLAPLPPTTSRPARRPPSFLSFSTLFPPLYSLISLLFLVLLRLLLQYHLLLLLSLLLLCTFPRTCRQTDDENGKQCGVDNLLWNNKTERGYAHCTAEELPKTQRKIQEYKLGLQTYWPVPDKLGL